MERKNTIIKGTLILIVYYLAAKILSFMIEMLIAAKFGPCIETDAYYLVDGIILSLSPMLSVGIWKLFMPEYKSRIVRCQYKEANEITHRLILVFLLFSLLLSLFIFLFSNKVVRIYAPGFDASSIDVSVSILNILLFTFILGTATIFPSAILQSGNYFSKSQLKEIVLFIPPLFYLLFFSSSFGIIGLAYSVIIGYMVALFTQYYLVLPYYTFKIRYRLINKDTINILKLYPVACINAVILQLNGVIGKMFSSTLAIGSITYLNYGCKIIHLFNGVFSTAVSVAVFPHLTEILTRNDNIEVKKFVSHYFSLLCALLFPVASLTFLFSNEIISVLFGYGKFDENSVFITARVLFMYGLGLVAMGLTTFVDDIFYITKKVKILLYTTILNIICNIIFAFLLIKNYDVVGLALASTISIHVSLLLKVFFIRDIFRLDKFLLRNIVSILFACLLAIIFIYGIRYMQISSGYHLVDLIMGGTIFVILYSISLLHNNFYKQQCKGIIKLVYQKISH